MTVFGAAIVFALFTHNSGNEKRDENGRLIYVERRAFGRLKDKDTEVTSVDDIGEKFPEVWGGLCIY